MTEKKPTKAETHAAKVSRNVYFVIACLVAGAVIVFGVKRCVG